MARITLALAVFVALQHVGFLVLEMFLWTTPLGRKVFRTTPEQAASSAVLAKNQGLYNGFLAAGLLFGVIHNDTQAGQTFITFFLCLVAVAGAYGAATVSRRIFLVQALPALAGLATVFFA